MQHICLKVFALDNQHVGSDFYDNW